MLLARTKKPSVLPMVGAYGTPFKPNNLWGRIQGSSSLRFPFASVWLVMKKDDDDGDDRSGDGAGC